MILFDYTRIVFKNRGLKKARVFFLRSFLYYSKVVNWLTFIDAFYKKFGFANAPWDLAGLPVRSYVGNNFSSAKRSLLLKGHYELMEQFFTADVIKKLLSEQNNELTISSIAKKDGEECYLKMAILGRFWREGGLTIYLTDKDSEIISTATFNFYRDFNGKNSLIISGMQGGTSIEKSGIVAITRSLGGLRPKYALVECCYALAECFGIDTIVGISDKNQIFSKQSGKIKGSYDELWKDIGGTLDKENNFLLPKELAKRDFESVPQKKRKDWLIRHNHMQKLRLDVVAFFKK
jgi:uncharacterized protein